MMQDFNRANVDVSSTGEIASFNPNGYFVLDILLSADAAITVELKQTDGDGTAPQTAKTYDQVTSIDDVLEGAATQVLVEVTTAASDGDTADFYIGVGD